MEGGDTCGRKICILKVRYNKMYSFLFILHHQPVTVMHDNNYCPYVSMGQNQIKWGWLLNLYSVVFYPSSLLCGSYPGNVFMAPGPQREAQEGHAAAGCVLRPPEEGPGENFPETEIYQQTRQEETC